MALLGEARRAMAGPTLARYGEAICGRAWPGTAREGMVNPGLARWGVARHKLGRAAQVLAGRGEARQAEDKFHQSNNMKGKTLQ